MKTVQLCTIGNGKRLHEVSSVNLPLWDYQLTLCGLRLSPDDERRIKHHSSSRMGAAARSRLCKKCVPVHEAKNFAERYGSK